MNCGIEAIGLVKTPMVLCVGAAQTLVMPVNAVKRIGPTR
jgi:hypothetical protein